MENSSNGVPSGVLNIALDIGNTRCKFSVQNNIAHDWAVRRDIAHLDLHEGFLDAITRRVPSESRAVWWVASVNHRALGELQGWVAQNRPADVVKILDYRTIPIRIDVDFPEKVGVDRLLAALCANALRREDAPAVVVDLGTALKVDLVSESGIFLGGAIAPGLRMGAIALEAQTSALPQLDVTPILEGMGTDDISSVGKNTLDALRAGLFWGMVGAVREITSRTAARLKSPPDFFITGGGASAIQKSLGDEFRFIEDMAMQGVFLAMQT
ncbi:MAG: type III pantothenate kinase [Planctomycetia bacterium]|nr:type III pantothenate kinase [Planctomycetia bacterium]